MIIEIINEYREKNGKARIFVWNPVENDYCLQHCLYMARQGQVEHAPAHLLKGKAEAIATCGAGANTDEMVRYLIFNVLDYSKEHREILLNYNNLAYGFYIHNYKAYLTIRGW